MSSITHLSRGSKFLLKVSLLVTMGLVIMSLVHRSYKQRERRSPPAWDELAGGGQPTGGTGAQSGDLDFNTQRDSRYRNPCVLRVINNRLKLVCVPECFVVGLDTVGQNLLYNAIGHHEDILTFSHGSSYLNGLLDMRDFNIRSYTAQFSSYARTIKHASNSDDLVLCDKGKLLARQYKCEPDYILGWRETALGVLKNVYQQSKIVIVIRNPVDRIYAEFCENGGDPYTFGAYVPNAIDKYQDCISRRPPFMCIYDEQVKDEAVLDLGAGLYCYLWGQLMESFPADQIHWVPWSRLTDPQHIEEVMEAVFAFLGVNAHSTYDFRNVLTGGDVCGGVAMDEASKLLLEAFYEPCDELMAQATQDPTFNFDGH